MISESKLEIAIGQFSYTAKDESVIWAPYLRNDVKTQEETIIRGLGKSSPSDIGAAFKAAEAAHPEAKPSDLPKMLTNGSLPEPHNYKGIDCSGFVYYVYDHLLVGSGKKISDVIGVQKPIVTNAVVTLSEWMDANMLSPQEVANLPETMSISFVAHSFKRNPVNLCNVSSLVSDWSSNLVETNDIQTGDLLQVQQPGSNIKHIAIISLVEKDSIEVTHATRDNPSDIGSIRTERIALIDGQPNTTTMKTPREFIAVRRLKI